MKGDAFEFSRHVGVLLVLIQPRRSCACTVCVRTSRNPVKDVFVYMSERVQPVIAARSYFLKHNGAGAVIIFGLEWLINF